jgi:hypothetical protein
MEVFISRFVIDNRPYYFRWQWAVEEFDYQVTDGKYVWEGKGNLFCLEILLLADKKYIERSLKPEGMELGELMTLLKQGLKEQDIHQRKFSYQIYAGQTQGDITVHLCVKLLTISLDGKLKSKMKMTKLDKFM